MKATTDAPAPMDTRTCQEKHSAMQAYQAQRLDELWTIVTQLQLEVAAMKRTLREWQGD